MAVNPLIKKKKKKNWSIFSGIFIIFFFTLCHVIGFCGLDTDETDLISKCCLIWKGKSIETWKEELKKEKMVFALPDSWEVSSLEARGGLLSDWLPSENNVQVPALQGGILVTGLQPVALAGTQRASQQHFPLPFLNYTFSASFPECSTDSIVLCLVMLLPQKAFSLATRVLQMNKCDSTSVSFANVIGKVQ